jgi:hypothetical protein
MLVMQEQLGDFKEQRKLTALQQKEAQLNIEP